MGFSTLARKCANRRPNSKECRAGGVCAGMCGQFVSFHKDVVADVGKDAKHGKVTAYELGMYSQDSGEVRGFSTTQATIESERRKQ